MKSSPLMFLIFLSLHGCYSSYSELPSGNVSSQNFYLRHPQGGMSSGAIVESIPQYSRNNVHMNLGGVYNAQQGTFYGGHVGVEHQQASGIYRPAPPAVVIEHPHQHHGGVDVIPSERCREFRQGESVISDCQRIIPQHSHIHRH